MKNYLILLFVLIASINLPAQISKKETSKKETSKKVKAKKETATTTSTEKRNLTFTKPKNAWQIGVFGGFSTLIGDVTPNIFYRNDPALPGHNFGLFVSKSWSYLISTRLRYSTSVMFTNDAVASTLTSNQYSATTRNNDIGLTPYTPGDLFFHNSRTQGHDLNFDLVFSIGNVNYHKERSPVVFKVFPSIGMYMYQTFYDHLDGNNQAYDYGSIDNLNALGVTNRTEIMRNLAVLRDETYETNAEEHTAKDENKILGYNNRFTYGFGAGFAIRLNKFLSLDIESRQTFVNDDLLDGMQWQEPILANVESRNKTMYDDSYNQTTIGLTYSIVTKKVGESLSMQNPLWGSDAFDNKSKDEESKEDSLTAELQNEIDELEQKVEDMDLLIKAMAEKQEEAIAQAKEEAKIQAQAIEEKERSNSSSIQTNGKLNDLDDETYKLSNGEYMHIADIKGDVSAAYYLIIGSFNIKANAKNHQRKWDNKGIDTYLVTDFSSGLYRVVVDYTNDHDKALQLLDEYRQNLDKTIWIIKDK